MKRRIILPLLACLAGLLLCQTSIAVPISDARARQLAPAVARVLLQRASTTALLQDCGQHYPHLQHAADRARSHWLHSNRQILQRADSLRERLLAGLKQEQSRFSAELFALNIDKVVRQTVLRFEHTLAAYPARQQHQLCNRLILSVRAGDWDISRKQAKAFAILKYFH
jgi:hypothetical protein